MHRITKLLYDMANRRAATTPVKQMSDEELIAEYNRLNTKIRAATSLGSALAAVTNEFRRECERELHRRNIPTSTEI